MGGVCSRNARTGSARLVCSRGRAPDAPRCGDGARAERFAWCNVRLTMPGRGAGHGFRAAAVRLADRAARTAGRVDGPLGFTVMVAGSLLTRGRVPADVGATMVAAARRG